MKIAFLNDGIYDYAFQSESGSWATGGAERQQWWLALALAADGWQVVVGVRRPIADGSTTQQGVKFVELGPGHILLAWRRFFQSERPDWWFWQCASHLFGFGVALAHVNGIRTIFAAGVDRDMRVRHALHHRSRWWPAYGFGLARTDRIVLQHSGQAADLPASWRRKAFIVPNIILSPIAVRGAQRSATVAWIAALRVAKRPDRLVEIARLLPEVRFVVCGSPSTYMTPQGYSERAIDAFHATPNINYRGQVSPVEAERVVAEASVLLSTSDEEGFPQTFLEAWSHGTPVVTLGIDPGGAVKTLALGAVCASVGDAAAAVWELIHDRQRWARESANAQAYVRQWHSPQAAMVAMVRAIRGSQSDSSLREGWTGARASGQ